MVIGLLYLILFQLLGEFVVHLFGWVVPGPVVGMILLLLFLLIRRGVPSVIRRGGEQLLLLLPLLLVPISVGVMQFGAVLKLHGVELVVVLVSTTVSSLLISGLLMKKLAR